jgi:hypothetical protein
MSRTDPAVHRDLELGTALRRLDVPDHAPSFFDDLERALRVEAAPRRPQRAPRRRLQLRWGMRIAAAAAVVAVGVAVFGLPGGERAPSIAGTQVASAAVVKAHVRSSLEALRSLSGVIVADGTAQGEPRRWRFALDATGDFRLEGPSPGEWIAYDASTGVVRSAQRSASMGGDTLFYAERSGVAPGAPDQGPPTWLLPDELGAYVRALFAAGDARVQEIRFDGRPAWRVDVPTVPNRLVPSFSGDRLEVTVDRETGIPVRVVESKAGATLRELRIEQLAVDGALPGDTFRPSFPAGAEVMRSDDGFHRVALGDVSGTVGYAPLVPALVPDGFALAEVAVATEAAPTGAGNPPSRMVVSLAYRRGLDRFVVTTREAGDGSWSDPLAPGPGLVDHPEHVAVGVGALRGSDAQVVLSPNDVPHLWTLADGLVVTVAGDLSRAQLVGVARSLHANG